MPSATQKQHRKGKSVGPALQGLDGLTTIY